MLFRSKVAFQGNHLDKELSDERDLAVVSYDKENSDTQMDLSGIELSPMPPLLEQLLLRLMQQMCLHRRTLTLETQ